jgi:hypothetical protein
VFSHLDRWSLLLLNPIIAISVLNIFLHKESVLMFNLIQSNILFLTLVVDFMAIPCYGQILLFCHMKFLFIFW